MRINGKLAKWNDERGFGFIEPTQGGQEIFVHISSFSKDDERPQINEQLSFDIEINKQGKKHAINVQRMGRAQRHYPNSTHAPSNRQPRNNFRGTVAIVLLFTLIAYGFEKFSAHSSTQLPEAAQQQLPANTTPAEIYTEQSRQPVIRQCDGRTKCSQMTSCDEALFFHNNCPGIQMDGDGDGIPCEMEFCNN